MGDERNEAAIPIAPLNCTNCGYTLLFMPHILGIDVDIDGDEAP